MDTSCVLAVQYNYVLFIFCFNRSFCLKRFFFFMKYFTSLMDSSSTANANIKWLKLASVTFMLIKILKVWQTAIACFLRVHSCISKVPITFYEGRQILIYFYTFYICALNKSRINKRIKCYEHVASTSTRPRLIKKMEHG